MPVPRVFAISFGFAALAIAACGSSDRPPPKSTTTSCSGDADCVLVTGMGCCVVCPGDPRAIPMLSFEQQTNRCADAGCPPPSDRVECPKVEPASAYVARCVEGTCNAVRKPG